MVKNKSCVSMLPSTENTEKKHVDEFNIKTNDKVKLPLLRVGRGVIKNHVDFSIEGKKKVLLYEHKFRVYKLTKYNKYKKRIDKLYQYLNLKELKLLKLNVEEVKVSDLKFMKVCSKCAKVSHQENDVIKCSGWY